MFAAVIACLYSTESPKKYKYAPFYNCTFGFACVIVRIEVIAVKTKDELPACPVATAVALVGGKWKLLILRNLRSRPWRFNALQRDLEGISQKVLTDSLRQMMDDGLVYRQDYRELPPRVEYGLTDLGKEMLPIIDALANFGNYYKSVVAERKNEL